MLTLQIERGSFCGVKRIKGQVTIGRSSANRIVIPDKWISDCHASIIDAGDHAILDILDNHQGVVVNDELAYGRRVLKSGDWLQIGRARLTVQRQQSPPPLVVSLNGHTQIASPAIAAAPLPNHQPNNLTVDSNLQICGVCQCLLDETESLTACQECRIAYHQDCWQENQGCAVYGCSQVGILKVGPDITIPPEAIEIRLPPNPQLPLSDELPWEYLVVVGSALATLWSLITEVPWPSLVAWIGIGLVCRSWYDHPTRKTPYHLATAICGITVVVVWRWILK